MPNITKEFVHKMLCNLPDDKKIDFAVSCARYGIKPEIAESICAPIMAKAIEYYKYWSDNNG